MIRAVGHPAVLIGLLSLVLVGSLASASPLQAASFPGWCFANGEWRSASGPARVSEPLFRDLPTIDRRPAQAPGPPRAPEPPLRPGPQESPNLFTPPDGTEEPLTPGPGDAPVFAPGDRPPTPTEPGAEEPIEPGMLDRPPGTDIPDFMEPDERFPAEPPGTAEPDFFDPEPPIRPGDQPLRPAPSLGSEPPRAVPDSPGRVAPSLGSPPVIPPQNGTDGDSDTGSGESSP